jgi:ankyrin repeat protein
LAKAKAIIEANPKAVNARDEHGNTPLAVIANARSFEVSFSSDGSGSGKEVSATSKVPLVAELLIAKGADVNAKNNEGVTPLIWAIAKRKPSLAKLLIKNGADVNVAITNGDLEGSTPLHFAAGESDSGGDLETANELIAAGAKIDTKNKDGQTPLYVAAINGLDAIVDLLLQKGAEINAKDTDGRTPLKAVKTVLYYLDTSDGIKSANYKKVIALLQNKGGTE